jgi:hypothetical protein
VTATHEVLRRLKPLWLSVWPLWTFVVFAGEFAVRLLPDGYMRAAVAAPILLLGPGSLTLGAIFSHRRRPEGVSFFCYAALLGVLWSGFASLTLYASHTLITASSTYWCLLIICAALAIVAEARIVLGRGKGRRAARYPEVLNPDLSDADGDDVEAPEGSVGAGFSSIVAVVAGLTLLVGGLYAYDHLPRPAPMGYTWIDWTGPPIKGDISVGPAGTKLSFQIVHRQSDTTKFLLSATWLGSPPQSLAKPFTLTIGPDRIFRGALFVPPPPDGCTYRIVVALTAAHQIDALTRKPQTWSINADVRNPRKPQKACSS